MLKARFYGTKTHETGEVICEAMERWSGNLHLIGIEDIQGSIDILDIVHGIFDDLYFIVRTEDLSSVETA